MRSYSKRSMASRSIPTTKGQIQEGAAAVDARSDIVKFTTELKPGSEFWITEYCTVIPENLTDSAIHNLRSMMRDIGYLGASSYLYWMGSSDRDKFAGEELIYRGTTGGARRSSTLCSGSYGAR